MDNKTIFTKTAKGLGEAVGKTKALSRDFRSILKEINGKASVEELQAKLGNLSEAKFQDALTALIDGHYIREFASPTVVDKEAGPDLDLDLDFSGIAAQDDALTEVTIGAFLRASAVQAADKLELQSRQQADDADATARQAHAEEIVQELRDAARGREETASVAKAVAAAQARREAEEKARRVAESQAKNEAEERARKKAAEQARHDVEEKARREAEARVKKEAEEQARKHAAEQAQRDAEEKVRREAEHQAWQAAEERARQEAAQAQREAKERARQEEEEKARLKAAVAQIRQEAIEKYKHDEEERVRKEAEEKARREAEELARQEAEEQARRDAEEKARCDAEEQARRKIEEKARLEAEEQARRQAEEQAARNAEEKARREAEEQVRREAEESVRLELEERLKLEAERQARREAADRTREEAEQRACRKAEEKAERVKREAAKQAEREAKKRAGQEARAEAETQRRFRQAQEATMRREAEQAAAAQAGQGLADTEEEQARLGIDAQVEREAGQEAAYQAEQTAIAGRPDAHYRKPVKWGKYVALLLFFVIASGLGWVQLVSFDTRARLLEKAAAVQFRQPVKIGELRMALIPQPHWRLKDVAIGKDAQIKVAQIDAIATLGTLFSDKVVFKRMEFASPVVTGEGLGWLLFGKPQGHDFNDLALTASNARLDAPGISLPAFGMRAELGAGGVWRKILLEDAAQKTHVELQPEGETAHIELQADAFAALSGSSFPLEKINAGGTVSRDEIAFTKFNGSVYDGIVDGNATLKWGAGWSLAGDVNAHRLDTSKWLPQLLEGGKLEGKATYTLQAQTPDQLFSGPRMNGHFEIRSGTVLGVELVNMLRGSGRGGKSSFSEADGGFICESGRIQLRNVRVRAGLVSVGGNADVDANDNLNGRFTVYLTSPLRQARAGFTVSGTLKEPRFAQ